MTTTTINVDVSVVALNATALAAAVVASTIVASASIALTPGAAAASYAKNINVAPLSIALNANDVGPAIARTITIGAATATLTFGDIEPPNRAKVVNVDSLSVALTAPAISPLVYSTTIRVDHSGITLTFGRSSLGPEPIEEGLVPCWDFTAAPPSTADAESTPSGDALLSPMLARTPRGPAWRTDEMQDSSGSSYMTRFWRAVCEPAADLYAKAWQLTMESTAPTIDVDALADWEFEYGLPDPCLHPDFIPAPKRMENLRAKVAHKKGQTPEYLICLAASIGYEIAIEEPKWFAIEDELFSTNPTGHTAINFEAGDKPLVSTLPIYFECSVSSAGDPLLGYPRRIPSWFIVHVYGASGWFFQVDVSQVGDALADFLSDSDLECVINRDRPAHTTPIFDYSGHPYPERLPIAWPISVASLPLSLNAPRATLTHGVAPIGIDSMSIAVDLQGVAFGQFFNPDMAGLALAAGAVAVRAARNIAVDTLQISLAANPVVAGVPHDLSIDTAAIALTAEGVSAPASIVIAPASASLALTANPLAAGVPHDFPVDMMAISLTPGALAVPASIVFAPASASISLTAEAVAAPVAAVAAPASASISLTAGDVTTPAGIVFAAASAPLALTAEGVSAIATFAQAIGAATLALTAEGVTALGSAVIAPASASLALTAGDVTVPGPPTTKTIFITSGTTWTVPSDWNSANNKIEGIGGGGGGAGKHPSAAGHGGGGAAYARKNNVTLTPGSTITIQIGTGGAGGATNITTNGGSAGTATQLFNNSSTLVVEALGAAGGNAGNPGSAGAGGAGVGSTGDVTHRGGDAAFGGGGAAGPNGDGNAASANTGGSGDSGSGGAGGAVNTSGSAGTEWTQTSDSATAGAGGGGGLIATVATASGNYGAGGAGSASASFTGAAGAPGIIVVTYTP